MKVLTTGQVASICRVSPRTVVKWFDAGELPGHKVPLTKRRRFLLKDVREFIEKQGMPAELLADVPDDVT